MLTSLPSSLALALASFCLLSRPVLSQSALAEPSGNQILYGAWVDTADDGTTPLAFNQRLGQNYSVFQISQNMPLPEYNWVTGEGGPAPEWLIEQTQTTAAVFLTIYPQTFDLGDADYAILGSQLVNYTETLDRTTFLRFAPEMQGQWFPYGFQSIAFKAMWIDMYTRVKKMAPKTIIVWAPNEGLGYPYAQTSTNATEIAAMDTSGDGQVTAAHDPISPWYPGDEYVDWIGMSIYYKGPDYQNLNQPQNAGFCSDLIQNIDGFTGQAGVSDFYTTYCQKAGKACMVAESGAAYHVDVVGGDTQLQMEQAWWTDCMVSDAFFDQFPRLKLWMHFEYDKVEEGDNRDYRLTNNTQVLAAFSATLDAFATRIAWASPTTLPPNVPASGIPPGVTGGSTSSVCTKYCGQVVFTTARNPATGAPSLFGTTRESKAARLQASIAVGATSVAMLSAMFWLTGRSSRRTALTSS